MVKYPIKTMIVDRCPVSLEQLKQWCRLTGKAEVVSTCAAPQEALDQLRQEDVELVLVDMDGCGMAGLAPKLRQVKPQVVVMCFSQMEENCIQAMRARADDFLFKPYGRTEVEQLIDKALLLRPRLTARILQVQTFGRFEVWAGAEQIHLPNVKGRELLALCVDRKGAMVSMEEVTDTLWPGEPLDDRIKKRYRRAILDIRKALLPYGAAQVLQTKRKMCRVVSEMLQCDYYDFLSGKSRFSSSKVWDYLKEYSWAESTAAKLYSLYSARKELVLKRGQSPTDSPTP